MTQHRFHRFAIAGVVLVAGLAGCTPNDTGFGGALKTDIAMQVRDPDPKNADSPPPGSGEQGALAAERYRKGTVKQPVSQTTRTSSGGGGGGGAGGAGGSGGASPQN